MSCYIPQSITKQTSRQLDWDGKKRGWGVGGGGRGGGGWGAGGERKGEGEGREGDSQQEWKIGNTVITLKLTFSGLNKCFNWHRYHWPSSEYLAAYTWVQKRNIKEFNQTYNTLLLMSTSLSWNKYEVLFFFSFSKCFIPVFMQHTAILQQ